jgi:hypothetical protein
MIAKELRGRMRGARAFVVLSLYLLFLTGFTLLLYFIAKLAVTATPTAPAGKPVFLGLVAFQLGLVCFLAPSFTAGAISGERERQTYDLLMTTPLPLPLILAAKLFSALAYVFLLIIAALPLMAVSLFLGGVAPEEVLIAFVMLCASALSFGTIGLCFSAWVRSTIGAAALSYGAMMLPVVALPIVRRGVHHIPQPVHRRWADGGDHRDQPVALLPYHAGSERHGHGAGGRAVADLHGDVGGVRGVLLPALGAAGAADARGEACAEAEVGT